MGIREQVLELREQKGRKEGSKERDTIFVKNLLPTTDFSVEQIAGLADVSIKFVQEIKAKL